MLTVDIVTPTRKLGERIEADSVSLPGYRGELQILTGHADLLTLLTTGALIVVKDGKERKFAISYGFAEVRDNRVLILAETAEEGTDIDKARALRAQKLAEEKLAGVLEEAQFNKYQLKVQRAVLRQQVSG